jgi:Holliday junction resolvase
VPKESAIVDAITRLAKKLGWWVMKIHGGPYQLAGVPDLLCIRRGTALFLEVKQPGKKPTAIQVRRMAEIESTGGAKCGVVTSKEEAYAYLRTDEKDRLRTTDDPTVARCERRHVRTLY